MMETTFHASIPETASAIKIHGESGLRLTLDVPESSLADALALIGMRGQPLRVTVVPDAGPLPFDEADDDPLPPDDGRVPF